MKTLFLAWSLPILLFIGCSSYHMGNSDKLDDLQKLKRAEELSNLLKRVQPSETIVIQMYTGKTIKGQMVSSLDGILTIISDDGTNDFELVEVQGFQHSEVELTSKLKVAFGSALLGAGIAFVLFKTVFHN